MIAERILDIQGKRPELGEIIVTLFEFCDLTCLFCNQDHDSVVGMDTVVDKFQQIKSAIDSLRLKGKKRVAVHIMGGEVFSDKVDDKLFDDYATLVNLLREHQKTINFPIEISFVTNFIWTKRERIEKFVEENDIQIMTSYDPSGRFNTNTLQTFLSNVEYFKDRIESVNVVMTKPNMEMFIKDNVPGFEFLYNNFTVFFDHYGPGVNNKFLSPKDHDLRDFMIYMVDNWPNCEPFKSFPEKKKTLKMACMETLTIMPDGYWGGCGLFEHLEKKIPPKNVNEQKWFDDYNCLECEHLNRCTLGCFMSNHVNEMRTQEECWLKEVYDHVDEKMVK